MCKEFLRDVVERQQGGVTTGLFRSHLLFKIDPVAEVVALIDDRRIARQMETEVPWPDVKQFVLPSTAHYELRPPPGTLDVRQAKRGVAVVVENTDLTIGLASTKGVSPDEIDLNLDEIFEVDVISPRANGIGTHILKQHSNGSDVA